MMSIFCCNMTDDHNTKEDANINANKNMKNDCIEIQYSCFREQ